MPKSESFISKRNLLVLEDDFQYQSSGTLWVAKALLSILALFFETGYYTAQACLELDI